jgi:hypothetical protein
MADVRDGLDAGVREQPQDLGVMLGADVLSACRATRQASPSSPLARFCKRKPRTPRSSTLSASSASASARRLMPERSRSRIAST